MKAPARIRFGSSWNLDESSKLNRFVEQVVAALTGNLSVTDNLRASFRDVTFVGPASSLSVNVSRSTAPKFVGLARLLNTDTGAPAAIAVDFGSTWSFANGDVITSAFSSLAAGNYRATLLIVEE